MSHPMRHEAIASSLTGIPAETLRGLRDGSLVAVPREPTQAMIKAGAGRPYREDDDELIDRSTEMTWAAMLAAAQEAPRDE